MANIKSFPNNQDEYIGAEHVMRWLHGRTSGVFGADDNAAVAPVVDSMAVTVSDGIGWLSNENADGIVWWINNEAENSSKLQMTIDMADAVLPRIDRVVVSWATTNYVDLPTVSVLTGVPASSPVAPALTNNNLLRQISLAAISVPAGATAITDLMITDERLNPDVCGIVSEQLTADTSMVNAMYLAAVEELRAAIQQAWSGEIPDGSITQEMLDPNIKLGSNDVYIGDEEPTGEDLPKLWIDPNDTREVPVYADIVKLWENASPASAFAAQTVALDLADYDFVLIRFIQGASSTPSYGNSQITPVGKRDRLVAVVDVSGSYNVSFRTRAATVTTSGIEFETAYTKKANSTSDSTNTEYCVPVAIYGIKGVK